MYPYVYERFLFSCPIYGVVLDNLEDLSVKSQVCHMYVKTFLFFPPRRGQKADHSTFLIP